MFWDKKSQKPTSGPREIPGLVQNYLTAERKIDPELVKLLKAVVRSRQNGEKASDIRIFDEAEAVARKSPVKDFTSLDEHPELVIYEGWFDETSKQVKLEEKKKFLWDSPFLTEAEIRQKIEALSEPGSTVFFYMARGSAHGGPLGMGCAVIELNPAYPGKQQKKYNVYTADVIDMQPAGKGQKMFGSDKPKEIARWVKDAHHKRMYSS